MIERETNLLTPNKKLESHILLSLDKLSPAENLRNHLIPSRDIADQRTQ